MVWECGSIPSYTDRIVMMRRLDRDRENVLTDGIHLFGSLLDLRWRATLYLGDTHCTPNIYSDSDLDDYMVQGCYVHMYEL